MVQKFDEGGEEIGCFEADRGESEVHDGVWFQPHPKEFAHLCSVPSQRASH